MNCYLVFESNFQKIKNFLSLTYSLFIFLTNRLLGFGIKNDLTLFPISKRLFRTRRFYKTVLKIWRIFRGALCVCNCFKRFEPKLNLAPFFLLHTLLTSSRVVVVVVDCLGPEESHQVPVCASTRAIECTNIKYLISVTTCLLILLLKTAWL